MRLRPIKCGIRSYCFKPLSGLQLRSQEKLARVTMLCDEHASADFDGGLGLGELASLQ
jgi:hypothetical protein